MCPATKSSARVQIHHRQRAHRRPSLLALCLPDRHQSPIRRVICYNGASRPPRVPHVNYPATPAHHRCPQPHSPSARGTGPAGTDPCQALVATRANLINTCRKLLANSEPTHVIAVFDGEVHSWRKEVYPAYKEGRTPMPPNCVKGWRPCRMPFGSAGSMPCSPRPMKQMTLSPLSPAASPAMAIRRPSSPPTRASAN